MMARFTRPLSLFILISAVLWIYAPFLSTHFLGNGDAKWYYDILQDSLIQLNAHIFPVYVGQSLYNYFGTSIIRAPYFILLGQSLYLLSFKTLNTILIQHLTLLISALGGALISYYSLSRLLKALPAWQWMACPLAIFYVSCPAFLGMIYISDAYYSLMTLPFLPLLFYGLIQNHQRGDFRSALLIAAALAALWYAHPPIALWATALAFIIQLSRFLITPEWAPNFKYLCTPFLLFIPLTLWLFVSVKAMHLSGQYSQLPISAHLSYAETVIRTLQAQIPGVFLPLRAKNVGAISFLQLGYSLWVILLGTGLLFLWKGLWRHPFRLIQIFLGLLLGLLLLLYPIPGITKGLWSLTPSLIQNITFIWPMQRLYFLLAPLICFSFTLCFANSHPPTSVSQSRFFQGLVLMIVLIGIGWNLHEAKYFKTFVNHTETDLIIEKHPYLFHNYIQLDHQYFFEGHYEPLLKNKLVDANGNTIAGWDNETIAQDTTNAKKKNYLLRLWITGDSRNFTLDTAQGNTTKFLQIRSSPEVLALHHSTAFTVPLENGTPPSLQLHLENPHSATLSHYQVIAYDPTQLPIQIPHITPWQATVKVPKSLQNKGVALEIFKEYFPGYEASVNQKPVSISPSKTHLILIPLSAGENRICLRYQGTFAMRLSFYISTLSWALLIFILLLGFSRKNDKSSIS